MMFSLLPSMQRMRKTAFESLSDATGRVGPLKPGFGLSGFGNEVGVIPPVSLRSRVGMTRSSGGLCSVILSEVCGFALRIRMRSRRIPAPC